MALRNAQKKFDAEFPLGHDGPPLGMIIFFLVHLFGTLYFILGGRL